MKPRHKIEDIVRPVANNPYEPANADLPPQPQLPERHLSYTARRRVVIGLGSLVAIALVVVGFTVGGKMWRAASAEFQFAKLLGLQPVASHVLPDRDNGYPKTPAGVLAYLEDFWTNTQNLLQPAFHLAGEARTLSGLIPQALGGTHGEDLIASLRRMRDALAAFNAQASHQAQSANASFALQQGFSFLAGHTTDAQQLLDRSAAWLDAPTAHHVAVLFGNSGELRPGGGFVGSYADVTIDHGAVTAVATHDVNDVDNAFDQNIIPPRELQPIARRWRAADANWFFNVPDSAQKILQFMNTSHLYADRHITLDGVVALSPHVIQGILSVTGPITLKDGTQITADNFLAQIQSDVQEGQSQANDHPKAVLDELVPAILARISSGGVSSSSSTTAGASPSGLELLSIVYGGLQDKNVVAYVSDPELENVIDRYGWSGRLFDLPHNFAGDYVGVTLNNVGGAKTDAVIQNSIAIREHLLPSGLLETQIDLTRAHQGDRHAEWWYNAPYKGYVKVFTPPDVDVLSASGMWDRAYTGRAYGSDFAVDPLVAVIEKTRQALPQFAGLFASTETARNVLSFWQKFDPGTTATASLDYVRPLPDPAIPGATYTFVVEKQPAADVHYSLEITAPPGFAWKENSQNVYDYTTDDLPARFVLPLTLMRSD